MSITAQFVQEGTLAAYQVLSFFCPRAPSDACSAPRHAKYILHEVPGNAPIGKKKRTSGGLTNQLFYFQPELLYILGDVKSNLSQSLFFFLIIG